MAINSLDIAAMTRVWDIAKMTKVLKQLLDMHFRGVLMDTFEGNSIQFDNAGDRQNAIRMLEAALQELERADGSRRDNTVRIIRHITDSDKDYYV